MSLPQGLQAILQILMAKRTLTQTDALALFERVKGEYHLECPEYADSDPVKQAFHTINKVNFKFYSKFLIKNLILICFSNFRR